MTCNRKIGWIAVLALALTHSLAPWSAAADPDEQERPPKPVVRTYDLSDLMRPTRNYPYRSDVLPPTKLHRVDVVETTVGGSGSGIFWEPEGEDRSVGRGRSLVGIAPLVDAIKATIDPESWAPRGTPGSIRSLGTVLIIRQTPENHKQIKELLEQLLSEYGPTRLVSVKAQWVLLNDDHLKQIVRNSDAKTSIPQQVDPKALEKIKIRPRYQAQTTCYSGQTVYAASGRGQTVVTSVQAVVTENVGTFQPMTKMVHWGAILELNAQISRRDKSVVLVDLHSIVSEPKEPEGEPISGAEVMSGAAVFGSKRGQVDRLSFSIQDLRTSLKVPLGRPVIVGGMTLSGTDSPLYLILEISASK